METKVTPAQRLQIARKRLGLTQAQLAGKCGWTRKKIQNIETSRQKLTADIALVLKERSGISAAWLLKGKEPVLLPEPLRELATNGDVSDSPRQLYEVLQGLSGRATIVTQDEIQLIHKLLRILRSQDPGLAQAITATLQQFERFSRLLNTSFGDLIILDRRVAQLPAEKWPVPTQDRRQRKE